MEHLQFFSNIVNPHNGGLYRELLTRGTLVEVLYRDLPENQGRSWKIPLECYERVEPRLSRNVQAAWQAGRRGDDPVLISGGYVRPVELGRILALAASRGTTYYWGEKLRPVKSHLRLARRAIFSTFDAVLAIGTWAVEPYRSVARAGALVHVFPYTTTSRRPVRTALSNQPTLGFVGSLIHRKGVDRVLRGLARLGARERPRLEIIGSGPSEPHLRSLATALGVDALWLGEHDQVGIDERRLGWWAQVVPSRYDGWGVVVPEALTAGVPVIASNATGAAIDLVRTGVNGMLVEGEDGWAAALAAYSDPARAKREGIAAREVGIATSAEAAAPWLLETLQATHERDFIRDAWRDLS